MSGPKGHSYELERERARKLELLQQIQNKEQHIKKLQYNFEIQLQFSLKSCDINQSESALNAYIKDLDIHIQKFKIASQLLEQQKQFEQQQKIISNIIQEYGDDFKVDIPNQSIHYNQSISQLENQLITIQKQNQQVTHQLNEVQRRIQANQNIQNLIGSLKIESNIKDYTDINDFFKSAVENLQHIDIKDFLKHLENQLNQFDSNLYQEFSSKNLNLINYLTQNPSELNLIEIKLSLAQTIKEFKEKQEHIQQNIQEIESILYNLPAENPFVHDLNQLIQNKQPISTSLKQKIEHYQNELTQQNQRHFIANTLKNSLEELGFEVETDNFETLFVENGVIHAQKVNWRDYHVKIALNPEEQRLNFNIVTESQIENRLRDQEVETEWCSEHSKLIQQLKNNGIDTKLLHHKKAGELKIQKIKPEQVHQKKQQVVSKKTKKLS